MEDTTIKSYIYVGQISSTENMDKYPFSEDSGSSSLITTFGCKRSNGNWN